MDHKYHMDGSHPCGAKNPSARRQGLGGGKPLEPGYASKGGKQVFGGTSGPKMVSKAPYHPGAKKG